MRGGMPLNEAEVADIVNFLRALTDPAARDLSRFTPGAGAQRFAAGSAAAALTSRRAAFAPDFRYTFLT